MRRKNPPPPIQSLLVRPSKILHIMAADRFCDNFAARLNLLCPPMDMSISTMENAQRTMIPNARTHI